MPIAERIAHISPFHVMEILARAQALEREGRDIIHMEIGEPDFPTPPLVREAAARHLHEGFVRYTPAAGLQRLREAVAEHYQRWYGIEVAPRRIIITPGASGALLLILGLILNSRDKVAVTDPGYPCYPNFIRYFGGEPVAIPVSADDDFRLRPDVLEDRWKEGLRGVIIASPANPTGTLMPANTLAALVAITTARGGFLVSDEIYHGLEYDGACPSALAYSPEVFVVNSFSKYFGMTGWRLGWAVVPEALADPAERLAQNIFIAAPTLSQFAALAAFSPENLVELERRKSILQQRRDFLCAGLERSGFVLTAKPGGAFYIFADCVRVSDDSARLAAGLLEQTGVAVTPGMDFGCNNSKRYVRFCYTAPLERLAEALDRIGGFVGRDGSRVCT